MIFTHRFRGLQNKNRTKGSKGRMIKRGVGYVTEMVTVHSSSFAIGCWSGQSFLGAASIREAVCFLPACLPALPARGRLPLLLRNPFPFIISCISNAQRTLLRHMFISLLPVTPSFSPAPGDPVVAGSWTTHCLGDTCVTHFVLCVCSLLEYRYTHYSIPTGV